MSRAHYTAILLLLIILINLQLINVKAENIIASGSIQLKYGLGAKRVFEKIKTIEVTGIGGLSHVAMLRDHVVFYWSDYASPDLHVAVVDIETGEILNHTWKYGTIHKHAAAGDILVAKGSSPNKLYYYKVDEGFGIINISVTGNYKRITSIVPYGNRIYLALETRDESYVDIGYIDTAESSDNKTFHKILSARYYKIMYGGELVTSNIWIIGEYKIYLNNATYTIVSDAPLLNAEYKLSPDERYAAIITHGDVNTPDKIKIYDVKKGEYLFTINLYPNYDVKAFYADDMYWINNTAIFLNPYGKMYFVIRLLDNAENYDIIKLKLMNKYRFKPYAVYGKYLLGETEAYTTVMAEIYGDELYISQKLYYKYRRIPHYMGSVGEKIVLIYKDVIYSDKMYVHIFEPTNEYVTPAYIKQVDYRVIDTGDDYNAEITLHIQPSDKWSYRLDYEYDAYGYPGGEVAGGGSGFSIDMPTEQVTITLTVYKLENCTHYKLNFIGYMTTYSDIEFQVYTIANVTISFNVEAPGETETNTTTSTTTTTPAQAQTSGNAQATQIAQKGGEATTAETIKTARGTGEIPVTMILGALALILVGAVIAFFFLRK